MGFKKSFNILALFLCFILLGTGFVFAKPRILVSHGIYDLGEIKEEKTYDKKFFIENIGDEVLKVKFDISCGCIKIISPKKEVDIAPGDKQVIEFKFDPRGYRGEVKRIIYIDTNDPDKKRTDLTVLAKVIVSPEGILKRFIMFRPGIVMLSGLADGVNPCAFTVLVFFISFLGLVGYGKKEMLFVGLSFILAVFLTYVLIGLGILEFIRKLTVFESISKIIYLGIAFFSLILGFLSIYDFWIYKKTKDASKILLQLPGIVKQKIHETIRANIDIRKKDPENRKINKLVLSALICGFIVSLFESVCTGQLYLPTIAYIFNTTSLKLKAISLLLLYNLMFIIPLLIIFRLSFVGMTSVDFSNIAKKHLSSVKLIMGLIFLLLGVVLIIIKS